MVLNTDGFEQGVLKAIFILRGFLIGGAILRRSCFVDSAFVSNLDCGRLILVLLHFKLHQQHIFTVEYGRAIALTRRADNRALTQYGFALAVMAKYY